MRSSIVIDEANPRAISTPADSKCRRKKTRRLRRAGKTNLEWAAGLGEGFRQLHDPVVAAYAISQLGALVCAQHREAGEGLFRESLVRLRNLTPDSFTSAHHRLPVPSFTSMWNYLTPIAVKCATELTDLNDAERAKAKMQAEKQQANDDVRTAYSALDIDNNPDRAAQLVETALSVSDPTLLDIPTVTLFLSHLRDKAPDVSDDLFPEVLDFIASTKQPSPGLLLELGKYLFTAPRYVEGQDVLQSPALDLRVTYIFEQKQALAARNGSTLP